MPSRFSMRKQTKKKAKKKGYIKVLLATFLVFLVLLIAGGVTALAFISDAPPLDPEELKNAQSSAIYDMNGKKIVDIVGKKHRIHVDIEDVPKMVQNAFISTEDARFREHFGIDLKRIAGAALANLKEGWGAEGGSTITQQVIKNTYLSPEKTIERKVKEAYLAIKLEQKYTKDEILEMYLNTIYFGHGAYGIGAAADVYFGKKVEELTLAEASLLAGLPQRPSGYDPIKYPDRALERRSIVLSLMEQHGYITEEDAEKAKDAKLEKLLQEQPEGPKFEAFIDRVISELTEKGIPEKRLYTGGLKIYTTLDPKAQQYTEQLLTGKDQIPFPNEKFKAGVVLLDTQTGAIRAIGGNRNPNDADVRRGFNYAIDTRRQPGSTIKPVLAYGPAIEFEKWSTYHQIEDEELEIDGKTFQNWDEEYHGMLSMRKALVKSYNIPAIKTFLQVGSDHAKEFAGKLGIPLDVVYPSYAIGGFEYGVSPMQMAGAYAAFGNQGTYHKPYTVRKIVYPSGETKEFKTEAHEAMNQYTAYMITDMLKDVVRHGTGTRANIEGLPLAGKTGTTNPPEGVENGSTDAWFVGYTTQYTAAVWTGYDQTTQEQYVTDEDSHISQLLFKKLMKHVSSDEKVSDFDKPSTVIEVDIDERNGKRASSSTPESAVTTELFVKGTDLPSVYDPSSDQPSNDDDKEKDEKEKKEDKKDNDDTGTADDDSDGSDDGGDDGSGDDTGDGNGDDEGGTDDGGTDDGTGDDNGTGDGGTDDGGTGDDGTDDGGTDDGTGTGDGGTDDGTGDGTGSGDGGTDDGSGDGTGTGDGGTDDGSGTGETDGGSTGNGTTTGTSSTSDTPTDPTTNTNRETG